MDNLTYLNGPNAEYVESLYQNYKEDPNSVEFGWQKFFEGFDFAVTAGLPTATVAKQNGQVISSTTNIDKEFAVFQCSFVNKKMRFLNLIFNCC